MKKLIFLFSFFALALMTFGQDIGYRSSFIQVETKDYRFGVKMNDGALVVVEDSCAIYQLTAARSETDSMNTAFRLGSYCTVAGGSGSSGVSSVTSATTNQLTVATPTTTPTLSIVTAAVANGETGLATGDQIYDWVMAQGFLTSEVDGSITNEIQNLGYTASTGTVTIDGTGSSDATIGSFSTSNANYGLVIGSSGNTGYFLRGDNTWQDLSGTYDNYDYWTISDAEGTPNTENISSTNQVKFEGSGIVSTLYAAGTNTLTITGTEVDGSTSNELQDLGYTASTGTVTITDGTSTTIGMFGTANANYGFTPGSNGNTTGFLRGDGTWATPSSGTDNQNLTWDATNGHIEMEDGNDADVGMFGTANTNYGFVPGSNGATTNFLRGDGTWAAALTGNETITLSGDVSGSGATSITTTIENDAVEYGMLNDNVISGQTALVSGLALDDEILVSDGGALKKTTLSVVRSLVGPNYQSFEASSGQTNFAVTEFDLTDEYMVFVNGVLNLGGHSRSTNTVTFTTGLATNSEVVILN